MKQQLPPRPNLIQLKHQAKDLLRQFRAGAPEAASRFREHHPRFSPGAVLTLSDAQLVIAREYGFAAWPALKHHVEGLENLESRVSTLRAEFAAGDPRTRERLLRPAHARERFERYDPLADSLSEADARLLVANQEGYAYWNKYESYLHLDPAVQNVIQAARTGDLPRLAELLQADPAAANPKWVPGFRPPNPIPNDSVPLFCISEGVFRGTNLKGQEYEMTRALINAGGDPEIAGGLPLTSALSFHAVRVVEALLDSGVAVDGVDGDGVPMAYPLHFSDRDLAELLARRGATLDLRFAAGVGRLDLVQSFFREDGTLRDGAGRLADPYGLERKMRGQSALRCERTPANILSQALYFACNNDRLEVADLLLSRGADINAIVPGLDFQGTVLHRIVSLESGKHAAWATADRLWPIVQFLLDRGASLTIRDREHHGTPFGWAYYCGRNDILDRLIDRAGIHDAVTCDRSGRVRELLSRDRMLADARDDLGRTPLHCLHGQLQHAMEIADLLVANGADLLSRDATGLTVLDRLSASGLPELANRLRKPR